MLTSIPALDEIVKDPQCAVGLSVEVLAALASACAAAQNIISAQLAILAKQVQAQQLSPADGDYLLTVDEAARILAVLPDWLYRSGKRLGLAVKLGDGTLRFSNAAVQAAIRDRKISHAPLARRKKTVLRAVTG